MNDLSRRIAALSDEQRELLKKRLEAEGLDFETVAGQARTNTLPGIQPTEKREYYLLSSVQKRLFVLNRLEKSSTVYNVPSIKTIEKELDKSRVQEAFRTLVGRHEALRASFAIVDGEPVQKIHAPQDIEFAIEYYETVVSNQLSVVSNFIRPFDLSSAPLLRVGLIGLAEKKSILILDMHHIVSDLTSRKILEDEFWRLYKGERLAELRLQYKDWAEWLGSRAVRSLLQQQERYWLDLFREKSPVLDLPYDSQRPTQKSYEGGSLRFKIGKAESAGLKSLAHEENTTLFVVVLALYNVLLAKLSRQEDIVVGIPISGRRHPGLAGIVGMFVNTLALRNFPAGEKGFGQFLHEVKQQTLAAHENQDYPFEDLVNSVVKARDTGRNPIFDVFFSFAYPNLDFVQQEEISEEEDAASHGQGVLSMFDLYLFGAELKDELLLIFTFSARLFKQETIERFIKYFKEIVSAVKKNHRVKLADIKISHDLGVARTSALLDEEGDFGF